MKITNSFSKFNPLNSKSNMFLDKMFQNGNKTISSLFYIYINVRNATVKAAVVVVTVVAAVVVVNVVAAVFVVTVVEVP